MPLVSEQIEDVFSSREKGIRKFLFNILYLNLQQENNENQLISIINKFLASSKNRQEGLEYLDLIINSCSSSIISENAINWIGVCIIKFPNDIFRELKLRLIGSIIEAAYNESDFNKKFVSDYISKVLDNCITTSHINKYECTAALKTLTVCMKNYFSWFGAHHQKIEDFVTIFLDSDDRELVKLAAVAFHYLQQVGAAGNNGINHKTKFTLNFHKLCNTIRKLTNAYFETESDFYSSENPDSESFCFPENPLENAHSKIDALGRRICNVLTFIESMIIIKFPVPKETRPKELLDLVNQILSFHKCITGKGDQSLESVQFAFQLIEIQTAALKILRLFIIWYQSNCLPFAYTISKTIVDMIEKFHKCRCYKSSQLPEYSYQALAEWTVICKGSLHPQFQDQILRNILKNICCNKSSVALAISETVSGKKSQKAKRRAITEKIIHSGNISTENNVPSLVKSKEHVLCRYALTALKSLLENTKLNISSSLLQNLYAIIFDSLIGLQTGKSYHPYNDITCQVKLYEALAAIYHQTFLEYLPPISTSVDILNRGASSTNYLVASACREGLTFLETICQPICPSKYVGTEKETDDAEEEENEHRLSPEMDVDDESSPEGDKEDELGEYNKSQSETLNISAEQIEYEVRLTESDRSTIEDVLSDKGERNSEFVFEELDISIQNQDSEEFVLPVVIAPSEDGNEILEGEFSKEQLEDILNDEGLEKSNQEANVDDSCNNTTSAAEKQAENEESKLTETETTEAPLTNQSTITVDLTSSNLEDVNNEPSSKKIKLEESLIINESKVVLVERDGEKVEEEEILDLNDDSFVDEVKDYY